MRTYNLNYKSRIWLEPGDDLEIEYNYGNVDLSGASITLNYEERTWAHMPHQYTKIDPGSFTDSDSEIDTSDLSNGNLVVLIGSDIIDNWVDRMLEFHLVTAHDNRQWSKGFTVTVGQGA